jgi:hypothetical protein
MKYDLKHAGSLKELLCVCTAELHSENNHANWMQTELGHYATDIKHVSGHQKPMFKP